MMMVVASSSRDEVNEHALKLVLDDVDYLCNEYASSATGTDMKKYMHLEFSTRRILDQLETSAIQHAKNEVMLLRRLQDCLAKLNDHCEKVLQSVDIANRLKSLRMEIQQIFAQTTQKSGTGPLPGKSVAFSGRISRYGQSSGADDEIAERTRTPSEEAHRSGHDQERSDKITDVSEEAMRRLQHQWDEQKNENGDTVDTSSDTKATKTKEPFSNPEPDERSQRIWLDEDMNNALVSSFPSLQKSRLAASPGVSMPRERTKSAGQVTPPTGIRSKEDQMSDSQSRRPIPSTMQMRPIVKEGRAEEVALTPSGCQSKCHGKTSVAMTLLAAAVVILPLALIGMTMMSQDSSRQYLNNANRRSQNPLVIGWQIVCGVANVVCEHYGVFCSPYCCSGLQREKWRC